MPSDERKTKLLCQSKTQPCKKNTELRRTLQKLVKIPNTSQGSFSCKIQGFYAESESIDSSLQAVNIRARANDDSSFPWLFGTGTFSQVAENCLKFKMAPRDFVAMLYLDDGIPVNSATFANEETWFELIGAELLVEHSPTPDGFAEAAGTEMCKGNIEYKIADVELDCTSTYPLAI